MEADWEFDLSFDSPRIETLWPGWIDLRLFPEKVTEIAEGGQLSGLSAALVRLNEPAAPVWTSKCDVWRVEEFDLDELDAPHEQAATAAACYIDLLPRSAQQWASPALVETTCRAVCGALHTVSLRCCRADLVIRHALGTSDECALGITAYCTASGPEEARAATVLSLALAALVDALLAVQPVREAPSKLQ
jgi:hypothetical protein